MAVEFLTDAQAAAYGRFDGVPSQADLERFFLLDDADKALIADRRGDHSRLGFVLQATTARYLGLFLEDPLDVPPEPHRPPPAAAPGPRGGAARVAPAAHPLDDDLAGLLRSAVEAGPDDGGWAHLGSIGHIITHQRPDFDSRSYGYAKLSDLIAATGLFDLDRRIPHDGKPPVVFARDKNHPAD